MSDSQSPLNDSANWNGGGAESAEQADEPVQGHIDATVYMDFDGDGRQNDAERNVPIPLTFFLDTNDDGVADPDEAVFPDTAHFFADPGDYRLHVVPPPGWKFSGDAPWIQVRSSVNLYLQLGIKPSDEPGGVIQGTVYEDDDFDGIRDEDEPGVAGIAVRLSSSQITLTDHFGRYRFMEASAGAYRLLPDLSPTGYFIRYRTPKDGIVFQFDGTTPVGGLDLGVVIWLERTNRIVGRVYQDINGNGVFNEGDVPTPNVTVLSEASRNGVLDAFERYGVTDQEGRYDFHVGGAIEQRVAVLPPPGWTASPSDPVVIRKNPFEVVQGPDFRLTPDDFAPAAITGTIFHDANLDGVHGSFEPPAPSVQNGSDGMLAYIDLDGDANYTRSEPAAPIDERGNFTFGGLAPGTYQVRVADKHVGSPWGQSTPSFAPRLISVAAGERAGPLVFGAFKARPNELVGWHFLYNNSQADGFDPAVTAADLAAIATDKTARWPRQAATIANVTNYSRGINGIVLEFASRPRDFPSARDLSFLVNPSDDPTDWIPAPAPTAITFLPDPAGLGTMKFAVTWPDGAIKNTWLQVNLAASPRLQLRENLTFYYGNLVADTGNNETNFAVEAADLVRTRNAIGSTSAAIDGRFDFNRDGRMDAADLVLARNNIGQTLAQPANLALVRRGFDGGLNAMRRPTSRGVEALGVLQIDDPNDEATPTSV